VDGKTALERITKFLNEDGIEQYVQHGGAPKDCALQISKGTFKWAEASADPAWDDQNRYAMGSKGIFQGFQVCFQMMCGKKKKQEEEIKPRMLEERPRVLKNVNLEVKSGSLTCIVGRVGSGKTSLLHAIMGELIRVKGDVRVNGRITYASQSAFIMNCSLRENITFGAPYDEEWYNRVIYACALQDDLDILPAGDTTQIGERGINLSGGQKQRVALARAVYQDAEIFLLDDPLSAVDAHVGKHIFNECILKLLKDKTVLLPCHALNFLQYADQIVTLEGETLKEEGTYAELISDDGAFAELMRTHASVTSDEQDSESADISETSEADGASKKRSKLTVLSPTAADAKKGTIIKDEERAKGTVDRGVYLYYASQCGKGLVVVVIICFAVGQSFQVFNTYIMSRWASADTSMIIGYNEETWTSNQILAYFLLIYSGTGFLVVAFTAAKVRLTFERSPFAVRRS
jgi:ABC-type Mn2+/Zn2+ transport system ATPase subunit